MHHRDARDVLQRQRPVHRQGPHRRRSPRACRAMPRADAHGLHGAGRLECGQPVQWRAVWPERARARRRDHRLARTVSAASRAQRESPGRPLQRRNPPIQQPRGMERRDLLAPVAPPVPTPRSPGGRGYRRSASREMQCRALAADLAHRASISTLDSFTIPSSNTANSPAPGRHQ